MLNLILKNILKNKKQVLDEIRKKPNNYQSIVKSKFDFDDNFNLVQMLRNSICSQNSIEKLDHFTNKLFKEFLVFFRTLLELKKMIYQSILYELQINITNNSNQNSTVNHVENQNMNSNNRTLTCVGYC